MVLNVSGRTDIVAFYFDWFLSRLKEGFVDVRNPFYPKQVSRILFDDVEALIFCTKNPIPLLENISSIFIPFVLFVTLTPYHKEIEPNVIKKAQIIDAIKKISSLIGKDKIYVRYDPVFISEKYSLSYHIKAFESVCSLLEGYIQGIIISFIDDYKNVRNNQSVLQLRELREEEYCQIGQHFSVSAKNHGLTVQTCSEERNLWEYGFLVQDCVTNDMIYKLTNNFSHYRTWKGRNNKYCHCIEMVDIGFYNSCKHFCKYCYANYDENKVHDNIKNHHISSSLLIGTLQKDDIIKVRK